MSKKTTTKPAKSTKANNNTNTAQNDAKTKAAAERAKELNNELIIKNEFIANQALEIADLNAENFELDTAFAELERKYNEVADKAQRLEFTNSLFSHIVRALQKISAENTELRQDNHHLTIQLAAAKDKTKGHLRWLIR